MNSNITQHPREYEGVLKMDVGAVTAIVGAVALVVGAAVTGFWQWLSGRKKGDAEAQASVMSGFVLLLSELRNERTQLVARINECEAISQRQDRLIAKLMRLMARHHIEIPDEDEA